MRIYPAKTIEMITKKTTTTMSPIVVPFFFAVEVVEAAAVLEAWLKLDIFEFELDWVAADEDVEDVEDVVEAA